MRKFWELVRSSTIVQGLVTLAFVGTACYLYATSQAVPDSLLQLNGLAVGFFFGAKMQQATSK